MYAGAPDDPEGDTGREEQRVGRRRAEIAVRHKYRSQCRRTRGKGADECDDSELGRPQAGRERGNVLVVETMMSFEPSIVPVNV
jgi:hypothetical protein